MNQQDLDNLQAKNLELQSNQSLEDAKQKQNAEALLKEMQLARQAKEKKQLKEQRDIQNSEQERFDIHKESLDSWMERKEKENREKQRQQSEILKHLEEQNQLESERLRRESRTGGLNPETAYKIGQADHQIDLAKEKTWIDQKYANRAVDENSIINQKYAEEANLYNYNSSVARDPSIAAQYGISSPFKEMNPNYDPMTATLDESIKDSQRGLTYADYHNNQLKRWSAYEDRNFAINNATNKYREAGFAAAKRNYDKQMELIGIQERELNNQIENLKAQFKDAEDQLSIHSKKVFQDFEDLMNLGMPAIDSPNIRNHSSMVYGGIQAFARMLDEALGLGVYLGNAVAGTSLENPNVFQWINENTIGRITGLKDTQQVSYASSRLGSTLTENILSGSYNETMVSEFGSMAGLGALGKLAQLSTKALAASQPIAKMVQSYNAMATSGKIGGRTLSSVEKMALINMGRGIKHLVPFAMVTTALAGGRSQSYGEDIAKMLGEEYDSSRHTDYGRHTLLGFASALGDTAGFGIGGFAGRRIAQNAYKSRLLGRNLSATGKRVAGWTGGFVGASIPEALTETMSTVVDIAAVRGIDLSEVIERYYDPNPKYEYIRQAINESFAVGMMSGGAFHATVGTGSSIIQGIKHNRMADNARQNIQQGIQNFNTSIDIHLKDVDSSIRKDISDAVYTQVNKNNQEILELSTDINEEKAKKIKEKQEENNVLLYTAESIVQNNKNKPETISSKIKEAYKEINDSIAKPENSGKRKQAFTEAIINLANKGVVNVPKSIIDVINGGMSFSKQNSQESNKGNSFIDTLKEKGNNVIDKIKNKGKEEVGGEEAKESTEVEAKESTDSTADAFTTAAQSSSIKGNKSAKNNAAKQREEAKRNITRDKQEENKTVAETFLSNLDQIYKNGDEQSKAEVAEAFINILNNTYETQSVSDAAMVKALQSIIRYATNNDTEALFNYEKKKEALRKLFFEEGGSLRLKDIDGNFLTEELWKKLEPIFNYYTNEMSFLSEESVKPAIRMSKLYESISSLKNEIDNIAKDIENSDNQTRIKALLRRKREIEKIINKSIKELNDIVDMIETLPNLTERKFLNEQLFYISREIHHIIEDIKKYSGIFENAIKAYENISFDDLKNTNRDGFAKWISSVITSSLNIVKNFVSKIIDVVIKDYTTEEEFNTVKENAISALSDLVITFDRLSKTLENAEQSLDKVIKERLSSKELKEKYFEETNGLPSINILQKIEIDYYKNFLEQMFGINENTFESFLENYILDIFFSPDNTSNQTQKRNNLVRFLSKYFTEEDINDLISKGKQYGSKKIGEMISSIQMNKRHLYYIIARRAYEYVVSLGDNVTTAKGILAPKGFKVFDTQFLKGTATSINNGSYSILQNASSDTITVINSLALSYLSSNANNQDRFMNVTSTPSIFNIATKIFNVFKDYQNKSRKNSKDEEVRTLNQEIEEQTEIFNNLQSELSSLNIFDDKTTQEEKTSFIKELVKMYQENTLKDGKTNISFFDLLKKIQEKSESKTETSKYKGTVQTKKALLKKPTKKEKTLSYTILDTNEGSMIEVIQNINAYLEKEFDKANDKTRMIRIDNTAIKEVKTTSDVLSQHGMTVDISKWQKLILGLNKLYKVGSVSIPVDKYNEIKSKLLNKIGKTIKLEDLLYVPEFNIIEIEENGQKYIKTELVGYKKVENVNALKVLLGDSIFNESVSNTLGYTKNTINKIGKKLQDLGELEAILKFQEQNPNIMLYHDFDVQPTGRQSIVNPILNPQSNKLLRAVFQNKNKQAIDLNNPSSENYQRGIDTLRNMFISMDIKHEDGSDIEEIMDKDGVRYSSEDEALINKYVQGFINKESFVKDFINEKLKAYESTLDSITENYIEQQDGFKTLYDEDFDYGNIKALSEVFDGKRELYSSDYITHDDGTASGIAAKSMTLTGANTTTQNALGQFRMLADYKTPYQKKNALKKLKSNGDKITMEDIAESLREDTYGSGILALFNQLKTNRMLEKSNTIGIMRLREMYGLDEESSQATYTYSQAKNKYTELRDLMKTIHTPNVYGANTVNSIGSISADREVDESKFLEMLYENTISEFADIFRKHYEEVKQSPKYMDETEEQLLHKAIESMSESDRVPKSIKTIANILRNTNNSIGSKLSGTIDNNNIAELIVEVFNLESHIEEMNYLLTRMDTEIGEPNVFNIKYRRAIVDNLNNLPFNLNKNYFISNLNDLAKDSKNKSKDKDNKEMIEMLNKNRNKYKHFIDLLSKIGFVYYDTTKKQYIATKQLDKETSYIISNLAKEYSTYYIKVAQSSLITANSSYMLHTVFTDMLGNIIDNSNLVATAKNLMAQTLTKDVMENMVYSLAESLKEIGVDKNKTFSITSGRKLNLEEQLKSLIDIMNEHFKDNVAGKILFQTKVKDKWVEMTKITLKPFAQFEHLENGIQSQASIQLKKQNISTDLKTSHRTNILNTFGKHFDSMFDRYIIRADSSGSVNTLTPLNGYGDIAISVAPLIEHSNEARVMERMISDIAMVLPIYDAQIIEMADKKKNAQMWNDYHIEQMFGQFGNLIKVISAYYDFRNNQMNTKNNMLLDRDEAEYTSTIENNAILENLAILLSQTNFAQMFNNYNMKASGVTPFVQAKTLGDSNILYYGTDIADLRDVNSLVGKNIIQILSSLTTLTEGAITFDSDYNITINEEVVQKNPQSKKVLYNLNQIVQAIPYPVKYINDFDDSDTSSLNGKLIISENTYSNLEQISVSQYKFDADKIKFKASQGYTLTKEETEYINNDQSMMKEKEAEDIRKINGLANYVLTSKSSVELNKKQDIFNANFMAEALSVTNGNVVILLEDGTRLPSKDKIKESYSISNIDNVKIHFAYNTNQGIEFITEDGRSIDSTTVLLINQTKSTDIKTDKNFISYSKFNGDNSYTNIDDTNKNIVRRARKKALLDISKQTNYKYEYKEYPLDDIARDFINEENGSIESRTKQAFLSLAQLNRIKPTNPNPLANPTNILKPKIFSDALIQEINDKGISLDYVKREIIGLLTSVIKRETIDGVSKAELYTHLGLSPKSEQLKIVDSYNRKQGIINSILEEQEDTNEIEEDVIDELFGKENTNEEVEDNINEEEYVENEQEEDINEDDTKFSIDTTANTLENELKQLASGKTENDTKQSISNVSAKWNNARKANVIANSKQLSRSEVNAKVNYYKASLNNGFISKLISQIADKFMSFLSDDVNVMIAPDRLMENTEGVYFTLNNKKYVIIRESDYNRNNDVLVHELGHMALGEAFNNTKYQGMQNLLSKMRMIKDSAISYMLELSKTNEGISILQSIGLMDSNSEFNGKFYAMTDGKNADEEFAMYFVSNLKRLEFLDTIPNQIRTKFDKDKLIQTQTIIGKFVGAIKALLNNILSMLGITRLEKENQLLSEKMVELIGEMTDYRTEVSSQQAEQNLLRELWDGLDNTAANIIAMTPIINTMIARKDRYVKLKYKTNDVEKITKEIQAEILQSMKKIKERNGFIGNIWQGIASIVKSKFYKSPLHREIAIEIFNEFLKSSDSLIKKEIRKLFIDLGIINIQNLNELEILIGKKTAIDKAISQSVNAINEVNESIFKSAFDDKTYDRLVKNGKIEDIKKATSLLYTTGIAKSIKGSDLSSFEENFQKNIVNLLLNDEDGAKAQLNEHMDSFIDLLINTLENSGIKGLNDNTINPQVISYFYNQAEILGVQRMYGTYSSQGLQNVNHIFASMVNKKIGSIKLFKDDKRKETLRDLYNIMTNNINDNLIVNKNLEQALFNVATSHSILTIKKEDYSSDENVNSKMQAQMQRYKDMIQTIRTELNIDDSIPANFYNAMYNLSNKFNSYSFEGNIRTYFRANLSDETSQNYAKMIVAKTELAKMMAKDNKDIEAINAKQQEINELAENSITAINVDEFSIKDFRSDFSQDIYETYSLNPDRRIVSIVNMDEADKSNEEIQDYYQKFSHNGATTNFTNTIEFLVLRGFKIVDPRTNIALELDKQNRIIYNEDGKIIKEKLEDFISDFDKSITLVYEGQDISDDITIPYLLLGNSFYNKGVDLNEVKNYDKEKKDSIIASANRTLNKELEEVSKEQKSDDIYAMIVNNEDNFAPNAGSTNKLRKKMNRIKFENLTGVDTSIISVVNEMVKNSYSVQKQEEINQNVINSIIEDNHRIMNEMNAKERVKVEDTYSLIYEEDLYAKDMSYQDLVLYGKDNRVRVLAPNIINQLRSALDAYNNGISRSKNKITKVYISPEAVDLIAGVETKSITGMIGHNLSKVDGAIGSIFKSPKVIKYLEKMGYWFSNFINESKQNIVIRNPQVAIGNAVSQLFSLGALGISPKQIITDFSILQDDISRFEQDTIRLYRLEHMKKSLLMSNNAEDVEYDLNSLNAAIAATRQSLVDNRVYYPMTNGADTNIVDETQSNDTIISEGYKKITSKALEMSGLADMIKRFGYDVNDVVNNISQTTNSDYYKFFVKLNRLTDMIPKIMAYEHYLNESINKNGKIDSNIELYKKEAITKAQRALINYNTPLNSGLLRLIDRMGVLPFARYSVRVLPALAQTIGDRPVSTLSTIALTSAIEASNSIGMLRQFISPSIYNDALSSATNKLNEPMSMIVSQDNLVRWSWLFDMF